jgi:hypothetical protein
VRRPNSAVANVAATKTATAIRRTQRDGESFVTAHPTSPQLLHDVNCASRGSDHPPLFLIYVSEPLPRQAVFNQPQIVNYYPAEGMALFDTTGSRNIIVSIQQKPCGTSDGLAAKNNATHRDPLCNCCAGSLARSILCLAAFRDFACNYCVRSCIRIRHAEDCS